MALPVDKRVSVVVSVGPMVAALREALSDSGMSQREVADMLGWEQPTLSRRMSGSRKLTVRDAEAIATVLGLEIVARKRRG